MIRPLFSSRLERQRIVTWLRRRSESAESAAIANEIAAEVDVVETQDLRDTSSYPTKDDTANALRGWAESEFATSEESEVLMRIAMRIEAALPNGADPKGDT